jgi:hypothetical protein
VVQNDHIEGSGGGTLFVEAAHVEALRVRASMHDLMHGSLVAVEGEDHRLVRREQIDKGGLVHPMGMLVTRK